MALLRTPIGITVNGLSLWVKDAAASAGDLFNDYQRVPGLASVTLPDESAPQNDVALLDGSIGAAGFAAVGTIAAPIGALTQHPVHRFLRKIKISGGNLLMAVRRAAVEVVTVADAATVASAGDTAVVIASGKQSEVGNAVREGHYISINDSTAGATVSDFDGAATQAADIFRAVLSIEDDGSVINVAPGVPVVSSVTDIHVILPGLEWKDVPVQVAQMGDGDGQNAANFGGNLVLRPNSVLPSPTIVIATTPDVT